MRMGMGWASLSGLVLVGVVALNFPAFGQGKAGTLPAVVSDAIKAAYPKAENMAGRGRNDQKYGVMVYNISFADIVTDATGAEAKQAMMVRVTDKGVLILALRQIPDSAVPPAAMDKMKKAAGGGLVKYPRRIEFFVDEKLVKYEKPRVQYEAMLVMKDNTRCNIRVAEDGGMIELTTAVKDIDVPKAVMEAMTKAADGGTVLGLCKVETFVDDKMVKLATPTVKYAAKLKKDKRFANIRVSIDGTVISQSSWR